MKITQRTYPPLRSEKYAERALPQTFSTFDLIVIYLAAIYFIGNAAGTASFGVVALSYLALGAVTFFLPCAIAAAQLGAIFPYEGSLYNWTYRTLGPFWSFFAGIMYWAPNVLSIMAAADGFVTYVQGLNGHWLTQPWQQGAVILIIIAFTTILALQRQRVSQYVVNTSVIGVLVVTALMALAGVLWLLRGHPSATPLSHPADWMITPANFSLFGLVALLYLGVSLPLNMAGEIRDRQRSIPRHLLWGTVLVLVAYGIATFVPLLVRGSALAQAAIVPYEIINTLTTAFGGPIGAMLGFVVPVIILAFYALATMVYNYANARLLFVAAVDGRIPVAMGRLNKHRVPANAIIFQSLLAASLTICIFFVVPWIAFLGSPQNLAIEAYNLLLAILTMVVALSTIFYFVDLLVVLRVHRSSLLQHLLVPVWLLWGCIIIGPLACLAVVADTLFNSWIPQMIPNDTWLILIGASILVAFLLTAMGSMISAGQVSWEAMRSEDTQIEAMRGTTRM
jgi:amino acid transporter